MQELTDEKKLEYIKSRAGKMEALNGLFFDSLHWNHDDECSEKFKFVCRLFGDYIYEIMVLLGVYEEDIEL